MRGAEPATLVRQLGLRTVLPANWGAGLAEVEQEGVFVTSAVEGHVFAVGADLGLRCGGDAERIAALVSRLSATFGRVVWFQTHDAAEVHGWMLADRGELVRGYAFVGDEGHVFWHGDVTDAERDLGCFLDDPRDSSDDEIKWWPDSRIVGALAAAWSVDPTRIEARNAAPALGSCGRL